MTTHAQKADAYLEMALSEKFEKSPTGDRAATLAISMAQAHATLELAEQQRIANLIALAHVADQHENVSPAEQQAWEALGVRGPGTLRPEIAVALGIEQDS